MASRRETLIEQARKGMSDEFANYLDYYIDEVVDSAWDDGYAVGFRDGADSGE